MELRYLRLIKAIVEVGSITRAIDRLHLSQSALSYQLKEAELYLGTPLFFRRNKKLILTPAGQRVYDMAVSVLKEIDQTETEIRRLAGGEKGYIRISTECYTSYHWLPPVLKRFKTLFPNVEVRIVFEATHRPVEKLIAGELDLAITSNPELKEGVEYVQLFTDEMRAIVAPGHSWAGKDHVEADDFKDVSLIIHSLPMDTVSVHRHLLDPKGVRPRELIVLPLTEAAIEMVKADMGVLVMARWAFEPYKNHPVKTVKIGGNGFFRQQYVARMADREYPLYFERFLRFLQEEIQLEVIS